MKFTIATALLAVVMATSMADGRCFSGLPPLSEVIDEEHNGVRTPYMWMFGLTSPTDAAPAGYQPCSGDAAYIAQYDPHSKKCLRIYASKNTPVARTDGCLYAYPTPLGGRATLNVTCDPSTNWLRMDKTVSIERANKNNYYYYFKGYSSKACDAAVPPLKKAAPESNAQVRLA